MYHANESRYETMKIPPLRRQRTDAAGSIFGLLAQFRRYRCL